jgi:hypothetical protein
MRLLDRVAQCRTPFVVQNLSTGRRTRLTGAADSAGLVAGCSLRYVLSDELTHLCAALAYSKGARTLECADLLHAPAERTWLEWCEAPWSAELLRHGFPLRHEQIAHSGRRGALLLASPDGRRGSMRTFWSGGPSDTDVQASPMFAEFDLDAAGDGGERDVLARCFRFRLDTAWDDYYRDSGLAANARAAIHRHYLGVIAIDVPLVLSFLLLLAARSTLIQCPQHAHKLNRSRLGKGQLPLLDHIEVRAPFLPSYPGSGGRAADGARRSPRLHHVRGHVVRRDNQLFWRIPHLRGTARAGRVHSRTVTWTFDRASARQTVAERASQA